MSYLDQIRARLPEVRSICAKYHVRELSIFGSVLRPEFSTSSDLDFLVEFEPQAAIGLLELAGMQLELQALFGRNVDLVPKKGLKPALKNVLNEAHLLYAG